MRARASPSGLCAVGIARNHARCDAARLRQGFLCGGCWERAAFAPSGQPELERSSGYKPTRDSGIPTASAGELPVDNEAAVNLANVSVPPAPHDKHTRARTLHLVGTTSYPTHAHARARSMLEAVRGPSPGTRLPSKAHLEHYGLTTHTAPSIARLGAMAACRYHVYSLVPVRAGVHSPSARRLSTPCISCQRRTAPLGLAPRSALLRCPVQPVPGAGRR